MADRINWLTSANHVPVAARIISEGMVSGEALAVVSPDWLLELREAHQTLRDALEAGSLTVAAQEAETVAGLLAEAGEPEQIEEGAA
jgi:uncharacterized protein YoaH (UPF0181 family)